MMNIKYCKRCKRAFDIDTNYEICPECRNKKYEVGVDDTKET